MPENCKWWFDEENMVWTTGCENMFIFTEGTPEDNQFVFCPYCGKFMANLTPMPKEDKTR